MSIPMEHCKVIKRLFQCCTLLTFACNAVLIAQQSDLLPDSAKKSLTVTSTPLGADVHIDGELVGKTPFTSYSIGYGHHRIRIALEGRLEERDSVDLKFGDHPTIHKRLMVPGGLNVNSTPEGAHVYVDTVMSGFTPATIRGLRPGKHRVRISTPGYHPWDQPVAVQESTITKVNVTFANVYSTLALDVEPEDAQVTIDTTRMTGANLHDYPLEPGYHIIRVIHPLIEGSVEERVYIGPNSHSRYAVKMGTFSPVKFGTAVLIPGLQLIREGNPLAGWGLLVSTIATATTLFVLENNFSSQLAGYDRARDEYLIAKDEQLAFELGQDLNEKYADLQKSYHIRNAFVGLMGGIYAYNLYDLLTSSHQFASNSFSKVTASVDLHAQMNLTSLHDVIRLNVSLVF